jgi:hypothetical protein
VAVGGRTVSQFQIDDVRPRTVIGERRLLKRPGRVAAFRYAAGARLEANMRQTNRLSSEKAAYQLCGAGISGLIDLHAQ